MASTRLLRPKTVHPLRFSHTPVVRSCRVVASLTKDSSFDGDLIRKPTANERRPADVSAKASVVDAPKDVITSDPLQEWVAGFASRLVAGVKAGVFDLSRTVTKQIPKKLDVEMLIERAIIDFRFFTWLAVAGTLLGSVLCFLEGCFTVIESYIEYFRSMAHIIDKGHVIQQLIGALDMFLVGTAMLIFGVSLHVMFIGPKGRPGYDKTTWPTGSKSNLFGLYNLRGLPGWVEQQSVSQAKSKIGHAVMIILQVGMLEKFNSIPIVTGLDLACFAGAVLFSSASIFLLSRLSTGREVEDH